ncbi:hypothetical protein Tco_1430451 [Tanacetum coccineum]
MTPVAALHFIHAALIWWDTSSSILPDLCIIDPSCCPGIRCLAKTPKYSSNEMRSFDIVINGDFMAMVFSTWMTFGGNTRDLGSFGEETNEIMDLHQVFEEVLLTKCGDDVASIKRRRHDLFSDDVWNLETASGRGRLKEDLESST